MPQSTEKRRVLETPVGARHKCQRGLICTTKTSDLIHSTNGNHLESPDEVSSIDHQVTIHLHAQNITMFPTNETLYFASQMLVSSSGGLYPPLEGPID
ncbi:phosphoglycerate kinase, chloroplastic-like [Dorcoceras hygrometricum]|uniref:Phosphoglycerate kinase, chloroplastic-like n=1 Tax=Dorcoceras hygrometricum TaxID=472368 RepID=A0A2Z7BFY8_9LAMI|nr:phosphoglycerate kinase, chloroplastic-like [Dorcoceras hygrometricum]